MIRISRLGGHGVKRAIIKDDKDDPRTPDRVMLAVADIFVSRCLSTGHPSIDHPDHLDTRWSAYGIQFLERIHQVAAVYATTASGAADQGDLEYHDWLRLLLIDAERRDLMVRSFDNIGTVGDTGFGAGLRYAREVLPCVHPETMQMGAAIAAAMLAAFRRCEDVVEEPDTAPTPPKP
ncbi:hypothetical protein [Azospirillum argentinense]|nr:hypothetical protein [Azospirillum argentinense]